MAGGQAYLGGRRGEVRAAVLLLPGIVTMAAGATLDVAYHLGMARIVGLLAALAGEDGEAAHLLLFVGMALVVAGLILVGLDVPGSRVRAAALPTRSTGREPSAHLSQAAEDRQPSA